MIKKNELSIYEKTSRNRINQLINEYCEGSQQRFAERTGLHKASVSQYVNGKNTPSNITAAKIAKAFDVDPAWVMGFDLPTNYDIAISETNADPDLVVEAVNLYNKVQSLPKDKQAALLKYLQFLQSDV